MLDLHECQLPCLPRLAAGPAASTPQPPIKRVKRLFAWPWNYFLKKWLKRIDRWLVRVSGQAARLDSSPIRTPEGCALANLQPGDWVRVRPREEIEATLNRWNELKGCAFLEYMWQYCGTPQQVLKPVERFLDERDYKVKKVRGVVILKDVICHGTPVFGRCDRCCHLFWRVEWLEMINTP